MAADKIMAEAFSERLPPGEGTLPLVSFVEALPNGVVLGLEVPMEADRLRGISAKDRVDRVVTAVRKILT